MSAADDPDLRDYTDLGVHTFFIDGPHIGDEIFEGESRECLVLDGRTEGQTLENVHPQAAQEYPGTGRIFARYICQGKHKWYIGSGFKVSNNLVVTAYHVIKPTHTDESVTPHVDYTLERIFFFPVHDSNVKNPLREYKGDTRMFEMELVADDPGHRQPITFSGPEKDNSVIWKNGHDFAFLRLKDSRKKEFDAHPFYIPRPPVQPSTPQSCVVVGYAGRIDEEKFKEDYTAKNIPITFEKVCEAFEDFGLRTASTGTGFYHGNIYRHTAPTLRGTSGGLFHYGDLTPEDRYFDGVHIGGSNSMTTNFTYPTSATEFFNSYSKALEIVGEDITTVARGYYDAMSGP